MLNKNLSDTVFNKVVEYVKDNNLDLNNDFFIAYKNKKIDGYYTTEIENIDYFKRVIKEGYKIIYYHNLNNSLEQLNYSQSKEYYIIEKMFFDEYKYNLELDYYYYASQF